MAETHRWVRARAGKAAEGEDGWGTHAAPSIPPTPHRPSSSHTFVCPVGGPRPRPRHLPCALVQDFEPRIHLADADFAALTAGGSLCDAEGALGPGEFDAAMRRQATCTRCACSGRCCNTLVPPAPAANPRQSVACIYLPSPPVRCLQAYFLHFFSTVSSSLHPTLPLLFLRALFCALPD